MTYRTDLARGRDIVARWCDLAEQRLEHLTELFESGRWRRYHSEVAFLRKHPGSQERGRNLARPADARSFAGQFRRSTCPGSAGSTVPPASVSGCCASRSAAATFAQPPRSPLRRGDVLPGGGAGALRDSRLRLARLRRPGRCGWSRCPAGFAPDRSEESALQTLRSSPTYGRRRYPLLRNAFQVEEV